MPRIVDTKMRALHLSTVLHETGHEFHVEDDGGAARVCDEEGDRLFTLSARTMAHLCGDTEAAEALAVPTLVAMVEVYRDAWRKGHVRGLEQGEDNAARSVQRLLGFDRIADQLTQTRKALDGLVLASKRQAG